MTDVDEGRRAPVWLTTVASTLSDRMRDRLEALAVLYTVVHLSGGGEAPTSRADVTEHMARLGANFYLGSLAEVYLGVDDAIDWLAQEGFLSGSHERTVAIPAGLGRMLASAAPGGAVEASEAALYRCIHRRYRQDLGEHAVVVDLSARMSAHAVKNQAEKLNAALGPLFAAIRGDRINPETAALVSLADTSEAIEELKDTVDAIDRYQSQAAEETTVDLAPMLETVVRKAEVEYPNTSEDGRAVLVSYRLDIDPAALPSIVVAEHLLRYSLNDLLENACHATRAVGGGEVVLRAGTDAIHHPDGDRPAVRFEIEDPGEGLPAELGPLLGARRFTMKPNGTGVGLALVQRMAERYGGYLREVPSPDQSGTCMRLVLPVEPITPDALGIGKPR
jgi:signal transduction histidine kinase